MAPLRPTLYPYPIIGWREYIRLPELAIGQLKAKIDTGAKTAALHAEDILIDRDIVHFTIVTPTKRARFDMPLVARRRVKSTSGHSENRAVISTVITIGEHEFILDVSLTDRTDMGVPMLLGRDSIATRFIVHPAKSFLLSKRPKSRTP